MNPDRKTAITAGILFLTAMVTSLLGGGILETVLNTPGYLLNLSGNATELLTGVSLEIINGIAVVGIAAVLFPVLRRYSKSISVGYVSFRIIESVFCIVSALIPLLILSLSRKYLNAEVQDASYYRTFGELLISVRMGIAGLLIPVFFSLGAWLFYYLLFRTKLIPRFISVWGFSAVILVFVLSFLETGIVINLILVLPIILNEIFLGIWLIIKGFNASGLVSVPVE
jgi:hypothetical protein